jgi:hypothetical protein
VAFLFFFVFVSAVPHRDERSGATSSRSGVRVWLEARAALAVRVLIAAGGIAGTHLRQVFQRSSQRPQLQSAARRFTALTAPHRIQSTMACCTGSAAAAPAPAAAADSGRRRTYEEECKFLRRLDANSFEIQMGFVPNMKVHIQTRIAMR